MIEQIITAVGPEEFIVASLFTITVGLWFLWSPANKTRREDVGVICLYIVANIAAGIRWVFSVGAAPIFGVTPKELRRLDSRPYYRQVGR